MGTFALWVLGLRLAWCGHINAALDAYGLITGTVTNSHGEPLAGVRVVRYAFNSGAGEWYELYDSTQVKSDAAGRFNYIVNGPGPYRFEFRHPHHEREFYDDQATVAVVATRKVKVVAGPTIEQDEPVAGLTLSGAATGRVGRAMTFEVSITSGENVTYTWDFGDDTPGLVQGQQVAGVAQAIVGGPVMSHTYTAAGRYVVTVIAQNNAGKSEITFPVTVDRALWLPVLRRDK